MSEKFVYVVIVVLLGFLFWAASYSMKMNKQWEEARARWYSECLTEHKRYTCDYMWPTARKGMQL